MGDPDISRVVLGLFPGGGGVIQGVVEGVVLYGVCSAQSRNFLGGVVKGVGVGVAGGIWSRMWPEGAEGVVGGGGGGGSTWSRN